MLVDYTEHWITCSYIDEVAEKQACLYIEQKKLMICSVTAVKFALAASVNCKSLKKKNSSNNIDCNLKSHIYNLLKLKLLASHWLLVIDKSIVDQMST